MMPQLEMEKLTKILKQLQTKKGLEEATDILHDEQDHAFISQLCFATEINPDIVRGIIVCYLAVREKLSFKAIIELENLFKL